MAIVTRVCIVFNNFRIQRSTQTMLPDNIVFSTQPGEDLHSFLSKKNYSSLSILADENTHRDCYPLIAGSIPEHSTIVIKSGEEEKKLDTCVQIWQSMTDHKLDRHACVVILGGGVIGDMGGFCASTYKRGIDFILIPTTLLAQADASIGGKLGIDFNHLKNHIGVFQQPTLALLHSGFLKTLPVSELRSGFAEIIKHTLISDRDMWNRISQLSLEQQPWELLLRHSVEFKAHVTTADPTEKGLRKILNAGHTIGHAVESYLLNSGKRVLHGEAIAAGLISESFIANKKGLLPKPALDEISLFILGIFGKIELGADADQAIDTLILQDKKNKGNKILCALLTGIGHAKWDCEISLEELNEALSFYRSC